MQVKPLLYIVLLINLERHSARAFREFIVDGVRTIMSLENESINIQCETDMPMAYCGFIHPSGKRFSFSGSTLIDGHCSIAIKATKHDTGVWNCHIGKSSTGVEMKQKILVRVVDKLAAVQPNVSVVHGKEVTLFCATTKTLTPLSYCRFEPPMGYPFSIGSEVNVTNAILGKYWFPKNKSLDRGDCAVTIGNVKYEDVGIWTCGAGLDDGNEYSDIIQVKVEGLYAMSTATVTGVTFGVIGVIAFLSLLGLVAWKKRRVLGTGTVEDVQEMRPLRQRTIQMTAETARDRTPQGSPRSNRQQMSEASPKSIRTVTPKTEGRVTPQGTSKMAVVIPSVVIQSPSEASSSPEHLP